MLSTPYKKIKTVAYTALITFVLTFLLLYGGCMGINKLILNHQDCERFAIDNYEIRTKTNIARAKDMDCRYDRATHTKSTLFRLNLSEKELSSDIAWNNMRKLTECNLVPFRHNPHWNDSIRKLPVEHLYTKSGYYKADSWIFVLDSTTQTMWAELTEDVNYKE